MRIAIVHYWLVGMRGGEKVLEALCELYPQADILTHVVDPEAISPRLRSHKIRTSFIAKMPRAKKWYKNYLPFMPMALEQLDVRDYDLIISSEAGPAKGIIPRPDAVHVCYCHSPMRYIWNMYHDYQKNAGLLARVTMPILTHYLRQWDTSAASRVDTFVANSHNVAQRIEKYYRRPSVVVYPPVAIDDFTALPEDQIRNYYLMVGELVEYKRADLAVEAFNATGRNLVIIGGGELFEHLRKIAKPNVRLLGPQPFAVLRDYYAHCQALIFPGEEDFGIVPVEAMASGRPVIALARGGALETVRPGLSGVLFFEQSVTALNDAVLQQEAHPLDSTAIRTHALTFSKNRFLMQMQNIIDGALKDMRRPEAPDDI